MKVVFVAAVAFLATEVQSFRASSWSSKPTNVLGMSVNPYQQDQMKSLYSPPAGSPPPPGMLSPYTVVQPAAPPESGEVGKLNGILIGFGVAFLGLPLWLLLATQVFFGGSGNTATPPAETVATSAPVVTKAPAVVSNVASDAFPESVIVKSQPITKAEVRNLFNLWNDALKTGDPATVAKRYSKDGVLLPTLSDVPRNDFEAIKDYFVGFLSKKPDGRIVEGEIYVGNNWAQDAGIYEFTFQDGSKVRARYSFIYVYEDGKWMISHQHSSLMPEEVVRPTPITATQVRKLFDKWNDALATGDPYKVAERYTKDAVLLPTLSDKARYTTDTIADYFVGFLKKKPTGEILEGNVKIGANWAQDAGIYEFTFQDNSKVRGRYTFVYTYEGGEWKIAHQHSSIMPEPAAAALKKVAEMK